MDFAFRYDLIPDILCLSCPGCSLSRLLPVALQGPSLENLTLMLIKV